MKPTKYVRLDQESIRKDFPEVFAKYEATHMITAIPGTQVSIAKLKANESVCYGDGKSFHFKLTKLKDNEQ